MIKRILSIMLSLLIAVAVMSVTATAQSTEKTVWSDGTYTYETIIEVSPELNAKGISVKAASKTRTGTKATYCKNGAGKIMWYVKVSGTFTYGNGTSKCTKSSVEAASMNSNWKITSKSSSKSGNKATAKASARHYIEGIAAETITKSVTLTCSSTGVLS